MKAFRHHFFPIIILLFLFSFHSFGQKEDDKEKIEVGVYVEDLYNINYSSSSYEIVFFLWVNSNNEFYDIENFIDILGSTEVKYSLKNDDTLRNGKFHSERKVTAKILNNFDVLNFPFDNPKLNLIFEICKDEPENLIVHFDQKNSRLIPDYIGVDRNEFTYNFYSSKKKYNYNKVISNFGNSDLGKSAEYAQINIIMEVKRDEWNIFAKLFITLFIAFILATSSILLPNEMSEEKFGLIVGSLFTSIGNKYITDELLPMGSNFNLSDRIHMLTFIFITLLAILAVVEQRYMIRLKRKTDLKIFAGVFLVYALFIVLACVSF